MKTITIPKSFGYPSVDIVVNNMRYNVKTGEEVTIDDHIAEVVENAMALAPKYARNISRLAQFIEGSITEVKGEEIDGIESIVPCAFYNYDNLQSIVIPDSITQIGYTAFGNCNGLVSVSIGKGVKTIGYNAFEFCTALTSIEIPESVTLISSNVFKECTGLKKVTMRPIAPPFINVDTFTNVPSTCIFEVPAESLEAYKKATNWSAFSNQIVAIEE